MPRALNIVPLSLQELACDPERLLSPDEVLACLYPPHAAPNRHHYFKLTRVGTGVRGTRERVILGSVQTPCGRASTARQVLSFRARLDEIAGRKLTKRRPSTGGDLKGTATAMRGRRGRRFVKGLPGGETRKAPPAFTRCGEDEIGRYPRLAEGRGWRSGADGAHGSAGMDAAQLGAGGGPMGPAR